MTFNLKVQVGSKNKENGLKLESIGTEFLDTVRKELKQPKLEAENIDDHIYDYIFDVVNIEITSEEAAKIEEFKNKAEVTVELRDEVSGIYKREIIRNYDKRTGELARINWKIVIDEKVAKKAAFEQLGVKTTTRKK